MKKLLLRLDLYLFLAIILLTFITRIYKINSPLADWHSWRQSDTSAVSRNFVYHGFDILHPRFDDLSNVASGMDNPQGYRFVEFPIFNIFQAALFTTSNSMSLESWGRFVSVCASVLSVIFIYLIVNKHADVYTALFAAFFYALLPYSIYYGRTILPDMSTVAFILGGIYFFDLWIDELKSGNKRKVYYILSILFSACALLLKPYAIFYLLPMLYLAWKKYKLRIFTNWQILLFAVLVVLPLVVWRLWMKNYPEGIPASDWLFNKDNIRFKGAFFYWLFADRIGRLILGYYGTALFIIGILVDSGKKLLTKNSHFLYMFLLASLAYLFVFAGGNVQHDYYQIMILPAIVIFLGLGSRALLFPHPDFINPSLSRILLLAIITASISFSWYFIRDYYNINNPAIIIAGEAADKILPKDAKIIANYNGDTTFLYQTKRKGWASFQNPLPEMIKKGAAYLLLASPTADDFKFAAEYKIFAQTKDYIIFDLHQPLK